MNAAKASRGLGLPLWVWILIAFLIWLLSWLFMAWCFPFGAGEAKGVWENRGHFGDMFGACNALASLLAFAGLLYTVQVQQREIRRQAKAVRKAEMLAALSAQIGVLVQIQSMPPDLRASTWGAIANARGGPRDNRTIEQAIATQIELIDALAQDSNYEIETIPSYGAIR